MQPKTKQNKIVHFYFVIFVHLIIDIYTSVNRWETGKHEPTIKIKRKIKALMREYDVKTDV